jgi:hypothetical protein
MINKQPAAEKEKEKEKEVITPDTILRRFKLYNDIVSKLRQQNSENETLEEERSF